MATGQRRALPSDSLHSPSPYSKTEEPNRSREEDGNGRGLAWFMPMSALGMLRYMIAASNFIRDCDEVFNYWEYSSKFALRSYMYLRCLSDYTD